ncbi:hypothetical protein [Thioalkalivibrio sp. ALJ24]|uniref:hypothetical protein n=1 Tax=Thioalkalivibrio sp. ALJ24 TaxID=545276 RepID=UPI0012E9C93C|nr:hypothetical protein [Thioalkalivibrio sp. ALJ24]
MFDRAHADEVERAHACADALLDDVMGERLSPYRARSDMMRRIVDPGDGYWQKIRQLKNELDPDNLIAPGRYNLP